MKAEVIVKFVLTNICNPEDLKDTDMTLEQMVKHLVKEEGLFGLTNDEGKIIEVKEIKCRKKKNK